MIAYWIALAVFLVIAFMLLNEDLRKYAFMGAIAVLGLGIIGNSIKIGRGEQTFGSGNPLCKIEGKDIYYGKIKGKPLWLGMTKINDENYSNWFKLLKRVIERSGDEINTGAKHNLFSLSYHGKTQADIWEVFIVEPSDTGTPDNPAKVIEEVSFNPFSHSRKMVMACTVHSRIGSIVTSHMGVFKFPFYYIKSDDKYRGISLDLHSFASKVMLHIDPEKKFQINTPAGTMKSIFIHAMGDHVYPGTEQRYEKIKEYADAYFNDPTFLKLYKEYKNIKADNNKGEEDVKRLAEENSEYLKGKFINDKPWGVRPNDPFIATPIAIMKEYIQIYDATVNAVEKYNKPIISYTPKEGSIESTDLQRQHDITGIPKGDKLILYKPGTREILMEATPENKNRWVLETVLQPRSPMDIVDPIEWVAIDIQKLAEHRSLENRC